MVLKVGRQDQTVEIEMQVRDLEAINRILMTHGNILNNVGQKRGQERCTRLREELEDKLREAKLPEETVENMEAMQKEICSKCQEIDGHKEGCPESDEEKTAEEVKEEIDDLVEDQDEDSPQS